MYADRQRTREAQPRQPDRRDRHQRRADRRAAVLGAADDHHRSTTPLDRLSTCRRSAAPAARSPEPKPVRRPRDRAPTIATPRPRRPPRATDQPVTAIRSAAARSRSISARPLPAAAAGVTVDPPRPAPVLVDAAPDPRADVSSPTYPPSERRAGVEGTRDRARAGRHRRPGEGGRAGQPQRATHSSPRPGARRCRAGGSSPATRDGVPYESWRTMTVRFVLEG